MTLFDTIDHYIREVEADLDGLSWEIREETNFDDEDHESRMDELCYMYDEIKEHLDNLIKIKQIIQNHEQHS